MRLESFLEIPVTISATPSTIIVPKNKVPKGYVQVLSEDVERQALIESFLHAPQYLEEDVYFTKGIVTTPVKALAFEREIETVALWDSRGDVIGAVYLIGGYVMLYNFTTLQRVYKFPSRVEPVQRDVVMTPFFDGKTAKVAILDGIASGQSGGSTSIVSIDIGSGTTEVIPYPANIPATTYGVAETIYLNNKDYIVHAFGSLIPAKTNDYNYLSSTAWKYDTVDGTWSLLAEPPFRSARVASTKGLEYEHVLYVVGVATVPMVSPVTQNTEYVEKVVLSSYSFEADSWTTPIELPIPPMNVLDATYLPSTETRPACVAVVASSISKDDVLRPVDDYAEGWENSKELYVYFINLNTYEVSSYPITAFMPPAVHSFSNISILPSYDIEYITGYIVFTINENDTTKASVIAFLDFEMLYNLSKYAIVSTIDLIKD